MDKGKLSTGANLLRLSTLGINFVLCTFAGLGLGWLAHKYLHLGGLGDHGGVCVRRFDRQLRDPFPGFKSPRRDPAQAPRSMTSPALNRTRTKPAAPSGSLARWMRFVVTVNLLGGDSSALTAYYFHQKDLALGFFLGSLLSTLNFRALQALTGKVLESGERGRKWFWFWNVLRWTLLAAACWLLLFVSTLCLAGSQRKLWLVPGGFRLCTVAFRFLARKLRKSRDKKIIFYFVQG